MIGAREAQRKRAIWTKSAGLAGPDGLASIPSGLTHDLARMMEHVRVMSRLLPRILRLNCSSKVRSLRLTQYGRKQRALSELCKRILKCGARDGDKRPVRVGIGDAAFSSSMRGHFPSPGVERLLEVLSREEWEAKCRVKTVGEYNTTKLCNECHKALESVCFEKGKVCNAVKRCANPDCELNKGDEQKMKPQTKSTIVRRDGNAGLNIADLAELERDGTTRPEAFTRQARKSQ